MCTVVDIINSLLRHGSAKSTQVEDMFVILSLKKVNLEEEEKRDVSDFKLLYTTTCFFRFLHFFGLIFSEIKVVMF